MALLRALETDRAMPDPKIGNDERSWARIFNLQTRGGEDRSDNRALRAYYDGFPHDGDVPKGALDFSCPGEAETVACRFFSRVARGPVHSGLFRRDVSFPPRVRNAWARRLKADGFSLVSRDFSVPILKGPGALFFDKSVWAGPKGVIVFSGDSVKQVLHHAIVTTDDQKYGENWIRRCRLLIPPPRLSSISNAKINGVFLSPNGSLKTRLFTHPIGWPLEPKNYAPEVVKFYGDLVAGFAERTPKGRLAILDGPPGTGKTFFLRALVHDLEKKAEFIYLPADLISKMDGPQMIALLERDEPVSENELMLPKILIVEDADECLVPRGGDNISSIRSLLNCCDGFLGSLLDLRVLATTNAGHIGKGHEKTDDALLRPGRLFGKVTIGPLDTAQGQARIAELLGKKLGEFELPAGARLTRFPISNVYAIARELGWKPIEE